jgi:hypothetical protein
MYVQGFLVTKVKVLTFSEGDFEPITTSFPSHGDVATRKEHSRDW